MLLKKIKEDSNEKTGFYGQGLGDLTQTFCKVE